MGNFLENIIDWGLSRERYWGTPLPVWTCVDCGKVHVIGSKQELIDLCGLKGDIELHRPYIDEPTFKCSCGGTMSRVKDVIDCWFDSGSMPFAQLHYPFENKELFEKQFPADFISEAVDQTRGWFYTLLVISTLLFDKAPFKNCIVLGHVNDKNGIKMSKHIGNVVDPWTVLNKQGADAVRWYFYTGSAPWLPSRFYPEAVSEAQRKFMGTLWNAYAFFVLYADIDGYDPSKYDINKINLSVMDKWILSKLNTLIGAVDKGLDKYQIFETSRMLQDYADELSNWYIRRGRERYWGKDMTEDKIAAYTTLYTVLVTLAKLSAPYVPFMAESIYQNLVPNFYKDAPMSVHLCSFPVMDESKIDKALEEINKQNEAYSGLSVAPLPQYAEGESVTALKLVRSAGIDPATGQEVYIKRNGEKTFEYDPADKVYIGDTEPRYTGSFNTGIYWKGFNLYALFNFRLGAWVYNTTRVTKVEGSNPKMNADQRVFDDRWKQPGDLAMYKDIADSSRPKQTDRFAEEENTLTFGTLNLSYEFKEDFCKKLYLRSLRAGVNFTELFRLSTVKIERGTSYLYSQGFEVYVSATF